MGEARFDENRQYKAKTRYSQKISLCCVSYTGEDQIRVDFEEPVRAITPGQSVVLYTDDWIAGGGVIE
jgi:tRNA-specific 2-thiouridylase